MSFKWIIWPFESHGSNSKSARKARMYIGRLNDNRGDNGFQQNATDSYLYVCQK